MFLFLWLWLWGFVTSLGGGWLRLVGVCWFLWSLLVSVCLDRFCFCWVGLWFWFVVLVCFACGVLCIFLFSGVEVVLLWVGCVLFCSCVSGFLHGGGVGFGLGAIRFGVGVFGFLDFWGNLG